MASDRDTMLLLHPQDVFVVLEFTAGVFSHPLGVVMFYLCVCVLSLYLSHSLLSWQLQIAHRWCSSERALLDAVATKEQREHCLKRFASPLLQTCWV